MRNLAQFAIALQLLNNDGVRTFFEGTNARIYQAFAAIGPEWASAYKTWMINKITVQNTGLQAAAQQVISAIPTAAGDPRAAGQEQRLLQWSAYMCSLLATYPVAGITIRAVQNWPLFATEAVAVPIALTRDFDVPIVAPRPVARAVVVDGPGDERQPAAKASITSIPANR